MVSIRIAQDYYFEKYLCWFNPKLVTHILSFRQRKDQLISFTSELLKKYYLADYLAANPHDLEIGRTYYGKPYLLNAAYQDIDFNISHSGDYVILAVVKNARVGIDLELQSNESGITELSQLTFSQSECQLVGDSRENFFRLWSKKEALLKALGVGFGGEPYLISNLNLESVEVRTYALTANMIL